MATKVFHDNFGEGTLINGMYSQPDADGNIATYDVMFEHGIERDIPACDLEEISLVERNKENKLKKDLGVVKRGKKEFEKGINSIKYDPYDGPYKMAKPNDDHRIATSSEDDEASQAHARKKTYIRTFKTLGRYAMKNEEVKLVDEAREPSCVAGTRIISKHQGENGHHAEVRYSRDNDEYQVHHYVNGKHLGEGPVSYHGSGKEGREDATDTANYEVKHFKPQGKSLLQKESVDNLEENYRDRYKHGHHEQLIHHGFVLSHIEETPYYFQHHYRHEDGTKAVMSVHKGKQKNTTTSLWKPGNHTGNSDHGGIQSADMLKNILSKHYSVKDFVKEAASPEQKKPENGGYNKDSVDTEIKKNPRIRSGEAKKIHALLKGWRNEEVDYTDGESLSFLTIAINADGSQSLYNEDLELVARGRASYIKNFAEALIAESPMPRSVLNHKKTLESMEPEELHTYIRNLANKSGKSVSDAALSLGKRHAVGNSYFNRISTFI